MSKEKSRDLTLKIFSCIIAFVLWSYVMSEVNPEEKKTIRNIPVYFNNIEALEKQGLVLMEPKEATVDVKVAGTRSDLAKFSEFATSSIRAQVDLSGYGEGQVRVRVNVTLNQANNIRIESISQQDILFTFEKLTTKPKEIDFQTVGSLDPGYVLGDITSNVDAITLRGPRSWVNEVEKVVAIVNIDGRKENATVPVQIKIVDDENNEVVGVKYEPTTIDVNIPVFRTVTVPIELNLENEPPQNYEITKVTITPSNIALKGDKDITNLRFIQTKPIDINDLMENPEMVVELDLPDNVSLLNPNEKVMISLSIDEIFTKELEYNIDEVQIRNLAEGLAMDLSEPLEPIRILVKGDEETIEALTKEDIDIYLDLNLLSEGEHVVYLGFNVPQGITVKEVSPQPMELKIINH